MSSARTSVSGSEPRASFSVPPPGSGGAAHRASLVMPVDYEEDPTATLSLVNVALATTPYPIVSICPVHPFFHTHRNGVFNPHSAWKSAVHGIKAIKRLKNVLGGGASAAGSPASAGAAQQLKLRSELTMVTGHTLGHMNLFNVDHMRHTKSCTHFNGVTVETVSVCNTVAYTTVHHTTGHGTTADSATVYMWDLVTMSLRHVLEGHDDAVTAIAVNEQDEFNLITAGSDKQFCLWNTRGQKVPSIQPLRKFSSKGGVVSQLIVSSQFDLCMCGTADGYVRMFWLATGEMLAQSDAHTAHITTLKWHTPMPVVEPTVEETQPQFDISGRRSSTRNSARARPFGIAVSSCLNGYVRGFHVEAPTFDPTTGHTIVAAQMFPMWAHRNHKASVTDVCWDGPLMMTVSSAENNVAFYHLETQQINRCHVGDGGLRTLACDPIRKAVVAGSDSGQIIVLNYKALATSSLSEFPSEANVAIVAILHPHGASVSGVVIERSLRDTWDRVISGSRDGSVCVMDFNLDRDSRTFHNGVSNAGFVPMREGRFVLTAWDREFKCYDTVDMTNVPIPPATVQRFTLEPHNGRIVALRLDAERNRVISASVDGAVRFYSIRVNAQSSVSLSSSSVVDDSSNRQPPLFVLEGTVQLTATVTCLSEVAAGLIAVGIQREASRTGHVAIIDVDRRTLLGPANASFMLLSVFPVRLTLLAETRSDHVIAVAQQRNGELYSFHVALSTPQNFSPWKQIGDETVFNYVVELDATLPFPPRFEASLDEHVQPSCVEILTVDGTTNRGVRMAAYLPFAFQSSGSLSSASTNSGTARGLMNGVWSQRFDADIEQLTAIRSTGCSAAVALQDATTHIISTNGSLSAVVRYDGSVIDSTNTSRPRRCLYKTSLESATSSGRHFPSCSSLAACDEARLLAIGYRDGLYQLYDLATKFVTRRVHAFGSPITVFHFQGQQHRLLSATAVGTIRIDSLLNRTIRAATEADPSAPTPNAV